MDKLRAMQVFVATADAGSFSGAAEVLGISAVMVGKHVRSLETQLSARLIERTTRRQALTEIGAAYLERCREVLVSVQDADRVAESLRAVARGMLRVTAPVAYGVHRLAPLLGDYLASHRGVQVELILHDDVMDLAEQGFDCSIRSGDELDPRLVARPLARSRMLAVASPEWVSRHGLPRHPSELEGHALLGFTPWGPAAAWRFKRGEEVVKVPVRGPLRANQGQALLNACVAGLGVAVQSDALLAPALAARQVVHLLPDWELPSRAMHILRLPEARPSAKLRSFIDFVVERLG